MGITPRMCKKGHYLEGGNLVFDRYMHPRGECRTCKYARRKSAWDNHYNALVWRTEFERAVELGQGEIVARLLKKSF